MTIEEQSQEGSMTDVEKLIDSIRKSLIEIEAMVKPIGDEEESEEENE